MPNLFRAAASFQVIFTYVAALYVFSFKVIHILHAVRYQTDFSRPKKLLKLDSQTIWSSLMNMWVLLYLVVLYELWVDQAKSNLSGYFKTILKALGGSLITVPDKAHWSLIAEHHREPLRCIMKNLRATFSIVSFDIIIDNADMAMSQIVGSESYTPRFIAFGA